MELQHKQVLVKHDGTYVRVYPSYLVPYPEIYESSKDYRIEPNTSQKRPEESPKVPISEENDMDENLETPNNNINRPPTLL